MISPTVAFISFAPSQKGEGIDMRLHMPDDSDDSSLRPFEEAALAAMSFLQANIDSTSGTFGGKPH